MYDSIYIYMYVCMCVYACMYIYIYVCVGERFKKGQISNLLGFRYLVPLGFRFHYFGFQICRGRQARCMAVANEFPCSWQRYRGWSPWRTCTSFHFISNFWPGQGLNPRTSLQVIFFLGHGFGNLVFVNLVCLNNYLFSGPFLPVKCTGSVFALRMCPILVSHNKIRNGSSEQECPHCVCMCVCTIWIDVKLLYFAGGPPGSRAGRWPTKTPPRDPWKRTCGTVVAHLGASKSQLVVTMV